MPNSRAPILCLIAAFGLTACGPRTVVSTFFPERYVVESTMEYFDGGRIRRQTTVTKCVVRDVSDSINNVPTLYTIEGEPHWIKPTGGGILVIEVGGHYPCLWDEEPTPGIEAHPPEYMLEKGFFGSWLVDDINRPQRIEVLNTPELFVRHEGYPQLRSFTVRVVKGARPSRTLETAFPGLARLGDGSGSTMMTVASFSAHEFIGVEARVRSEEGELSYLRVEPDLSLLRFTADLTPQHLVRHILYSSASLPVDGEGMRPWFPQLCLASECADPPKPSPGNIGSSADFLLPDGTSRVEMSASSIRRSPDTFGIKTKRR